MLPALGILYLFLAAAAANLAVILTLNLSRTRFLARFDLLGFRPRHYLALLPNALEALHQHGIASPWPGRLDTFRAGLFRLRLYPALRGLPRANRRRFLHMHLNLAALLEVLRPFIRDAIMHEEQKILVARLVELPDGPERNGLLAYAADLRDAREAFARQLTLTDRRLLFALDRRRFFNELKLIHAVFREHGYSLMPDLEHLQAWDNATGQEIATHLPPPPQPQFPWPQLTGLILPTHPGLQG